MPDTIEDPAVLEEITECLGRLGYPATGARAAGPAADPEPDRAD